MKIAGKTIMGVQMVPVYECEYCNNRSTIEDRIKSCEKKCKEKAVKEHHEEEGRAGIL